MLGGLALKRRWQEKMKKLGKDIHNPGPNIVMGAEAQVALEKFARYFEVEARLVPITKEASAGVSETNQLADRCNRATMSCLPRMPSTTSMRTPSVSLCEHVEHLKVTRLMWSFSILGSTYTGVFESVQEMSDELDKYEQRTGNSVPIHVDAASGGFVA